MFNYSKFSLKNSRLVYDSTADKPKVEGEKPKVDAQVIAEAARQQAIDEALNAEGESGDIAAAAKTKIDNNKDADQETKDAAKKSLDSKTSEFEAVKQYLVNRAKIKKLSDTVDKTKDQNTRLDYLPQLEEAKKTLSASPYQDGVKATLFQSINGTIQKIEAEAKDQYTSEISRASTLNSIPDFTEQEFFESITAISTLEGFRLSKFRGVKADEQGTMDKDSSTALTNLIKKINDHKDTLSDDAKKKFESDYQDSFKLLSYAHTTFDASRTETADKGWKAGAEQFTAMAVAQSKANDIQKSIPSDIDWTDAKYASSKAVYDEAVKNMAEGKTHVGNSKPTDSLDGAKAFEKARIGFLEVKAAIDAVNDKETTEKDTTLEKGNAKTAYEAMWKFWNENIKGKPALEKYAKSKGLSLEQKADGIYKDSKEHTKEEYAQAAKDYTAADKAYQETLKVYTEMKANAESSFKGALDRIKSDMKINTEDEMKKVVQDYMGNPASWGNNAENATLYQGFTVNGTMERSNGYYRADITVTFENGKPLVSINRGYNISTLPVESREAQKPQEIATAISNKVKGAISSTRAKNNTSPGDFEDETKAWVNDVMRTLSPTEKRQMANQQLIYSVAAAGKNSGEIKILFDSDGNIDSIDASPVDGTNYVADGDMVGTGSREQYKAA